MATLAQNKPENKEIENEVEELKKANKALEEAKIAMEAQLQQKTEELEKFRLLTIGRELMMIRLKNEIAGLREELAKAGSLRNQYFSSGMKIIA